MSSSSGTLTPDSRVLTLTAVWASRSIQQSAALALGRLANYSDELAESVVTHEILPQLVYSLSQQNRFYKKAAAFVLRAVARPPTTHQK